MKIEAIGYPNDYRTSSASGDPAIIGLQHQIVDLTERLKDMSTTKPI